MYEAFVMAIAAGIWMIIILVFRAIYQAIREVEQPDSNEIESSESEETKNRPKKDGGWRAHMEDPQRSRLPPI